MEGKKNERDQRQVKSKRETNRRNMKIGCRCNIKHEKEGNENGRREDKKIMMIRKLKEKKGGGWGLRQARDEKTKQIQKRIKGKTREN